jgi:hypothetical protein
MKHTDCFYLYAWLNKNPYTVNMGKKVSKKGTYVSSLSSMKFWNDFGGNKLEQYCIFESLDEAVVGAAEWWGLDYGIKVLGKEEGQKLNAARKDVVNMPQSDREKLFKKYGYGYYSKWVADGKPKL